MRLLLVIAVILVLAMVLFGGGLDEVANVIVQILQVLFNLLVSLINLFVELLKSVG